MRCCTGSCCVGHRGPVCHGVPALGPAEAGVMPPVAHSLQVRADGHAAPHTGVGAELVRALQAAARPSFSTHYLPCRGSLQWWQTSWPWCLPCTWEDLTLDEWTVRYIRQGLDVGVNNRHLGMLAAQGFQRLLPPLS